MTRRFSYLHLHHLLAAIMGGPDRAGLAVRDLPVASVLLPLNSFARQAREHLQDFHGLVQTVQDPAERDELAAREVEVAFPPVLLHALEGRDDLTLSLADLEILERLAEDPTPTPTLDLDPET